MPQTGVLCQLAREQLAVRVLARMSTLGYLGTYLLLGFSYHRAVDGGQKEKKKNIKTDGFSSSQLITSKAQPLCCQQATGATTPRTP